MTAGAIADRGKRASVFDKRLTERLRRRRIDGRDCRPSRDRERTYRAGQQQRPDGASDHA